MLGLVLIGLAVPRGIAAWIARDAQPALWKMGEEVPGTPTEDELQLCVDSLEQAIRWYSSGSWLANLGSCELEMARGKPAGSPDRKYWLARS